MNAMLSAVAPNYHPLPVTLARGEGSWVFDTDGSRYLDLLSAYSALNFGHRHPRLVEAAQRQLERLTLTSRAFHSDNLESFCAATAKLCNKEMVVPMNTGAEAVETAIKAARRWGYRSKGVPADRARIVVFDGNFHGRTTTIVGFSSDHDARSDFGPFADGFDVCAYGALPELGDDHVAVLVEPIQGEAGVVIPPDGWLRDLRDHCDRNNVLLIADEIQSGLGRTGATFACEHEGVEPDLYLLGKALGGGIVPLSAVVGDASVLGLMGPGSHGSTFGGNPLACAVGIEVVSMLSDGSWQEMSRNSGRRFRSLLDEQTGSKVTAIRSRGLWVGMDLSDVDGREFCERMLEKGVLAKDTHGHTVRFAPPLNIASGDLEWAVERIAESL